MDQVQTWLHNLNLDIYAQAFEQNGWDDMEAVKLMTESDIKDVIEKPGHARKVQAAIAALNEDKQAAHVDTAKKTFLVQTSKFLTKYRIKMQTTAILYSNYD